MEKKIKLVVCEKSNELFVAPGECVIEEGDLIDGLMLVTLYDNFFAFIFSIE